MAISENEDQSTLNTLFSDKNNTTKGIKDQKISSKSKIIDFVSELLSEICDEEDSKLEKSFNSIKPFLSKKIPPISIKEYLQRLIKYSKINNSTIILILIYIDRLCGNLKFKLNHFNIHKIILASFVLASKYNEDEIHSMNFYSKLGGVSKKEMIKLEYEFISLIDFDLSVDTELYNKYRDLISDFEEEEDDE